MRKIAITEPYFFSGEAEMIVSLLEERGFWRVHIRKPGAPRQQVKRLVEAIPRHLYSSLTFHDYFDLAAEISVGGIHLNSRNPEVPSGWDGLISRSFHSVGEIGGSHYDYAFLSPIYPSISKPGYRMEHDAEELKAHVDSKIFALGGVTPEKFDDIDRLGFGGCAMLGCAWRKALNMRDFRLQFITHPVGKMPILQQVESALEGGCRWIQLRHKDAYTAELLREGLEIRQLCDRYGAVFIVDDHVDLVGQVKADGVHLGKNDMPVLEARCVLGPSKIIGATANCFDDIRKAAADTADYIGLGPYRFTTTKAKLSPVLGLEGYERIAADCAASGIFRPTVAIGGITLDDIPAILAAGMNGIAISGSIINAPDPIAMTKEIIKITDEKWTN